MAKPIAPTPILEGEDAEAFIREALNVKYDEKREKDNEEALRLHKKFQRSD